MWIWVVVGVVAFNAATYVAFWDDKRQAQNYTVQIGHDRIKVSRRWPEHVLLMLGFVGGWPFAWLAIYSLRHKTSWRKRWFRYMLAAASAANVATAAMVLYCFLVS